MSTSLSTQVKVAADRTVVTLGGDLDVATGPSLQAVIDTLVGAARTLELELSRLRFVDSFGYGVLVRCIRLAQSAGTRVEVTALHGAPRALGDRYGLDALLAPCPT